MKFTFGLCKYRKRESIYPLVQEPKRNGKDMSEATVKDAVLAETSRLTSLKALALAHPKPFIATGLAVLVLTAGTVVFMIPYLVRKYLITHSLILMQASPSLCSRIGRLRPSTVGRTNEWFGTRNAHQ